MLPGWNGGSCSCCCSRWRWRGAVTGKVATGRRRAAAAGRITDGSAARRRPGTCVTTVLDDGDGPVMCLAGMLWSTALRSATARPSGAGTGATTRSTSRPELRGGASSTLVGGVGRHRLHPDRGPRAPPDDGRGTRDDPFTTACEEPEGGWVAVEPATTTSALPRASHRGREALPDYGLVWGDQSINPTGRSWRTCRVAAACLSLEAQQAMNDPALTILNVGVTEDLARAEAAVREVWGGPLCVDRLDNTVADCADRRTS